MNMEINPSEYKVLIVDDVISNVLLLKVLLTNEKFNIVTAGNGTQALEQVKNCLLYTSPSPRDLSTSRMPSSA